MSRGIFVLRGDEQLIRSLGRAADRVNLQMKPVNKKAADLVAAASRGTAPRLTGRLAGTIRAGATKRAGVVRAGRASVPYAQPIHWGWPARNIRANPWLSEAAQSTEPGWTQLYSEYIDEVLEAIEGA